LYQHNEVHWLGDSNVAKQNSRCTKISPLQESRWPGITLIFRVISFFIVEHHNLQPRRFFFYFVERKALFSLPTCHVWPVSGCIYVARLRIHSKLVPGTISSTIVPGTIIESYACSLLFGRKDGHLLDTKHEYKVTSNS
jgi:hypothetical protein